MVKESIYRWRDGSGRVQLTWTLDCVLQGIRRMGIEPRQIPTRVKRFCSFCWLFLLFRFNRTSNNKFTRCFDGLPLHVIRNEVMRSYNYSNRVYCSFM